MRNVFVVTDPEATHVVEGLVGGWYNSSLTAQGSRDAQRIADRLVTLMPGVQAVQLVTSDLHRAQQTAAPIAQAFGAAPLVDSDVRERSYGAAEGKAPGLHMFLPPSRDAGRMDHHPGTLGTETRREWATRAYRALERVVQTGAENTVIVTHGGTLTYLISAWIGLPLEHAGYEKFASTPGGITHRSEDDVAHDHAVITLNDSTHLGPPAPTR
jgi:probable phosphoglycerate mutase